MSLADIKSKIEADAFKEAETHREKVQEQIDAISREASRQVEQLKKDSVARLESEKQEVHRRRKIVAELDVKKESLSARRKLIDEAFEKAISVLVDVPSERYVILMEKLLQEAVETGEEVLVLGKKEKVLSESWLELFNKKNNFKLSLSDERESISGGFILRKGRVDTNCSWDMLLNSLRIELEAEVVRRLFTE